ncbi:hypothetical protein M758_UG325400 [Ceratodon purpureus]|nr:hypothetical protein M758_UG325400 [Ceratodon purpureus]
MLLIMATPNYNAIEAKSELRERYNGEPSWVETVIIEYELGPLGPTHNCQGYCDCVACSRFAWIRNPTCSCPLAVYLLGSLSLGDAMRQKWRRCQCSLQLSSLDGVPSCWCILLLPTQEWTQSPSSSYSLPSDLVQSPYSVLDLHCDFTEAEIEVPTNIVRRLEKEERRYLANESFSHATKLIVNEATTDLISCGNGMLKTDLEKSLADCEDETEDRASSSNILVTP